MSRDIAQLHPELQDKIAQLRTLCEAEGLQLGIGECFRSVEEQDTLYAQGRTISGQIVTYARGSSYSSQHQWGIAFDFFKNVAGHAYDDTAFFKRVGALGKSIGLGWGGDWITPVDMPHLYLPYWGDTPTTLKRRYSTFEAFKATWPTVYRKDGEKVTQLVVDGYWGTSTTLRLQEIFCTPQDGIVSDQWIGWQSQNPGLTTGWEWRADPKDGSQLIRAMQRKLQVPEDGLIGHNTILALQLWLGTPADGYVSDPSPMVKALQTWANNQ